MKDTQYLRYLLRHKWFVFLAGRKTGAPIWRLIIHDWSKFLPSEWIPYAEYFYGTTAWLIAHRDDGSSMARSALVAIDDAERLFNYAWLHHQHANPHHWQHWILHEDSGSIKVLEMPEKFVREMVADWIGAGLAMSSARMYPLEIGDGVKQWYLRNRTNILFHEKTRALVEQLLREVVGRKSAVAVQTK